MRVRSGPGLVLKAPSVFSFVMGVPDPAILAEVRRQGGTWTQIGTVYGTTKQGAQQRFRGALAREHAHD